jgi:hypothetical protein
MIGLFAAYLFWAQKKFRELEQVQLKATEAIKLKLKALERLALYAERTKMDKLIGRLPGTAASAADLRYAMLQAINEEYDHNATQQLYVPASIWEATTRMRDQNAFIINQVASILPAGATGTELQKQLLQLTGQDPNTTMNKVVLEALQFEVQKIIG